MKNPRVANAFNAMKEIGIPVEAVKPVLKNLLVLYDKNWEFIEAENYRALADAIFERKDNKGVHVKKENGADYNGSFISGSKKLHIEAEEENEVSSTPSDANMTVRADEDHSRPVTSEAVLTAERSSSHTKKHRGETSDMKIIKHKTEDSVAGSSLFPPCISKNNSVYLEGSSSNSRCSRNNQYDIVSSPSGDIKLSLDTNSPLEQTTIDAVFKSLEENLLKSRRVVGPSFSLKELLEELCQRFVQMGVESSDRCLIRKSPPNGTDQNGLECIIESLKRPQKVRKLEEVQNGKNKRSPSTSQCPGGAAKQPHIYVKDITKGEEKVQISLVDESGKAVYPKFSYIPCNQIYQNARVNISLARISDDESCADCLDNCLSGPVPCACARETGGEYAYTVEGLLKKEFLRTCMSMAHTPKDHHFVYCQDCPNERLKNEKRPEPCKGHLMRKFVKECWSKCGCDLSCGNRVVQRGITRKLQVVWINEVKGWGLQTLEDLPEGAFVCEYVGEILTNMELHERNLQKTGKEMHTYPVQLDADWASESILKDEDLLCLDATYYGNVARFINHRCNDANLMEIPVTVETVDHHYYHLAFFTTRKVEAYEELSWDYGIDFDDRNHPIKAFRCNCGSALCRDKNRKSHKGKGKAKATK